jgi:hypothetical protein
MLTGKNKQPGEGPRVVYFEVPLETIARIELFKPRNEDLQHGQIMIQLTKAARLDGQDMPVAEQDMCIILFVDAGQVDRVKAVCTARGIVRPSVFANQRLVRF